MKHLDLFSGIGGFALAAQWTWKENYENVGHCEIEEFPCKVYHKHFPESRCLGDITKVEWREGQADIITGGFPCQPHSVAGNRLASEDERDLWSECWRTVSTVRPRYALFENVAGLLTSESGRFFNRVLADLASVGYDAQWQIIPACAVGAPHTRERVWIIAYPTKTYDGRSNTERWTPLKLGNSDWRINWRDRKVLTESGICRKDDGVRNRLDNARLETLGNAIVPQVAFEIFKRILEVEKQFERGV